MGLLSKLKHPLANSIDNLDEVATYGIHRNIILSKPFLLEIYRIFYQYLLAPFKESESSHLKIVEIGAGGFNSNHFHPHIITTDLHETPFIKQVEDAHALSFAQDSLDGLIMLDVLHHIPGPELFFKEAGRCLKPRGKLVMIEPYYSLWSSLIYKNLHHEPWSDSESWSISSLTPGRLSAANMKMPYNIFIRDRTRFEELFPNLEIVSIEKINFFSYLLSGGVSYRGLIPGFMGRFVFMMERLLKPFSWLLAMHMVIEIRKK